MTQMAVQIVNKCVLSVIYLFDELSECGCILIVPPNSIPERNATGRSLLIWAEMWELIVA